LARYFSPERDVPKAFDEKKEASAESWLDVGMQSRDNGAEEEDIKMALPERRGSGSSCSLILWKRRRGI
jgi:hypothetical protein